MKHNKLWGMRLAELDILLEIGRSFLFCLPKLTLFLKEWVLAQKPSSKSFIRSFNEPNVYSNQGKSRIYILYWLYNFTNCFNRGWNDSFSKLRGGLYISVFVIILIELKKSLSSPGKQTAEFYNALYDDKSIHIWPIFNTLYFN